MKKSLFLVLTTLVFNAYSQGLEITDEQRIKRVINQFFESLETKDSLLMQQTTMKEAQIWRRYSDENPIRVDLRYSKDDLPKMHTLPKVKEVAQDFEIIQRNGIAIAWVPYEFWVEDKFSHCGIDVFTLFEIDGDWKIMSTAYTIERENCGSFIRKN
ncbi:nuclear transport factor 2 family protein [Fulvivirgaceae bacterium BMA12]|uniref:Nuclear transport factor 2 family protein n=1 Tax=Agaribacillus aureus TaxID=3051825 RepID=A0ABT8LHG1_9BACT|nr:nuclear transport factor 2 family protein [Fulvivirgaceae bacterium BMA12]